MVEMMFIAAMAIIAGARRQSNYAALVFIWPSNGGCV